MQPVRQLLLAAIFYSNFKLLPARKPYAIFPDLLRSIVNVSFEKWLLFLLLLFGRSQHKIQRPSKTSKNPKSLGISNEYPCLNPWKKLKNSTNSSANFFSKSFLIFWKIIHGQKEKKIQGSLEWVWVEDNARFAVTLILGT